MKRFFKKFFYGLFFLLLFFLIIFSFLKDDLNLKRKEEISILPLEIISEPKILYLNKNNAVLVFKLLNPNQNYSLNSFLYNLELYDFNDNLLKNILATSYIYAQEEKYFAFFLNESFYRQVKKIKFKLENFSYLNKDIFVKPLLKVKDISFEDLENNVLVKVKIDNLSNYDLEKVNLVFLFYDENNKLVSAYNYNLEDILLKNKTKEVEFFINFDLETKKEINFNFTKVFVYGK